MGENINETVKLILSLSVSGGLFVLALFVLKPFMRNRLSKSFQYYIWLVVLLRFIVPFSFGINLMDLSLNAPGVSKTEAETVIPNNPINPANVNTAVNNAVNNNEPVITEQQPSTQESTDNVKTRDVMKTLADNLLWIWLTGMVISAAWNIFGYLRFIRYVHGAAYAVQIPDCSAKIFKSRFAPTPMLVGVIKPRIYLPDIEYTDGQLSNILLHELTHLRRHDVWLKWFAALVVSAHWFNPIAYLMRREFNRACELACDEAVIRKLDGAAKQSYGDTLISVVAESRYPVGVMSVTMCEEKKKLKERLVAIMNYKKKTKIAVLITTILAVVITGSAFAFGADILSATPKAPPVIKILANGFDELPYVTNTLVIPYDPQFDTLYYSNTIQETSLADETLIASLQITDMPGIQLDFGKSNPDSVQVKYRFVRLESNGQYSCNFGGTYHIDYANRNSKLVLQYPTIPVARQNDDKIVGRLYIVSATWKAQTFEYAFIVGCDIMREMAAQETVYDISLAELRQLAAKGDELVFEDFNEYNGQDVGFGLYILHFNIEGGYTLLVGGGKATGKPMYTYLEIPGIEESIDIRYDNIDEFIGKYHIPDELRSQIYGYLETIMSSPSLSSATGDYIRAHQTEYDTIMNMGITALPALTGLLNSGDMSLRGNIAALLVRDIIAEENKSNKPQSEWREAVMQAASSDVARWGIPPNDNPATNDEKANDLEMPLRIISVTVDHSLNWNNMYPRIYTSGEKINAVLDYIDELTLKDEFPENPNEYDGSTSTITILFDDGTKSVYYHFGNMFFGKATESGIDWKRMEYKEAVEFDTIIQNNLSD